MAVQNNANIDLNKKYGIRLVFFGDTFRQQNIE